MTVSPKIYLSSDDQEEIRRVCERAFQNGGPRIFVQSGRYLLSGPGQSLKGAMHIAEPGDTIWRRRKKGREYIWGRTALAPIPAAPQLPEALKAQPLDSRPRQDGESFLVLLVNGEGQKYLEHVENFEGQMYPARLGCNIDFGDRVTTALGWLPLP